MAPVHGNNSATPIASPPNLKLFRPQNLCVVRPARLRLNDLVAHRKGDACGASDKSMHR
jgi:hypothetical protein